MALIIEFEQRFKEEEIPVYRPSQKNLGSTQQLLRHHGCGSWTRHRLVGVGISARVHTGGARSEWCVHVDRGMCVLNQKRSKTRVHRPYRVLWPAAYARTGIPTKQIWLRTVSEVLTSGSNPCIHCIHGVKEELIGHPSSCRRTNTISTCSLKENTF